MLRKLLEDIGLNANEADVYLAALKLGTQDIATLSKETKLAPFDVSVIMTRLLDRGFVSKFSREKDFFTPEQPGVVVKILENGKSKLEASISNLKKNLSHFEDYMNPSFTKPEIAFYEGPEGIVAAYEDTLTSKTEILAFASVDDTETILPEYVAKYYKRRKAAKIPIRAIFPDTKMSRARQKKDTEELRESRLLPKHLLSIEIEINIYDDKVAYFSIPERLAVIVKSKLIAASMRDMFGLCWKMAEVQLPAGTIQKAKGK
jgi:sugar-specific transcriptional regulator TrmB